MRKSGSPANSKTQGKKSRDTSIPSSSDAALPSLPTAFVEDLPPLPPPPVSSSQLLPAAPSYSASSAPPSLPPLPADIAASPFQQQSAQQKTGPAAWAAQLLPPPLADDAAFQLPSLPPPPDLPPLPDAPASSSRSAFSLKDLLAAENVGPSSDNISSPPVHSTSAAASPASTSNRDSASSHTSKPPSSLPQPSHAPHFQIAVPGQDSHPVFTTSSPATNAIANITAATSSPPYSDGQQNGRKAVVMSPDLHSPAGSGSRTSSLAFDGISSFSGSVSSVLQKFKTEQNDLVQVIKEKEECLSQLLATAKALVSKERMYSNDLNRIRRERQEQLLEIRRLSAEQSRYREICDSVNAQVALVSSSFSSKLGLSSSSTTAPISASEDDWLATVQHKLKAFESQAAAVSQAYNDLQANFAATLQSERELQQLFVSRLGMIEQLQAAEAESAAHERDAEARVSETRESINRCGQIIAAAQTEILHTRSLYISSSSRISELGSLVSASSPTKPPGSVHRFLPESPSGKTAPSDPHHYHGFRVSSTSHADVVPSAMDYLRLPNVSPPSAGPQVVVETDSSKSQQMSSAVDTFGLHPGLLSPSLEKNSTPTSAKKKMGMSTMFRPL